VNDKDSRDSRDSKDFRVSVDIDAPPARVWSVMSDVERWSNWIEPTAQGSRVTLSVGIRGLFAGLLARLTGAITDRYLGLEAAGLKRQCEALSASGSVR